AVLSNRNCSVRWRARNRIDLESKVWSASSQTRTYNRTRSARSLLEAGGGRRRDNHTLLLPRVAEAVRNSALEEISLARSEHSGLTSDRDLQHTVDHNAGLFPRMAEHNLARVRTGFIGIFHHLQSMPPEIGANLPHGVFAEWEDSQVFTLEEYP